jgi:hypothetical protein
MPAALRILLLLPALAGWAVADLPRKAPISKYTGLWMNSPFTSKPPPPEAGPVANPLEDYTLGGVSPITGGYRVTLLNKKKPEERIITETDKPAEGFKILGVTRKPGDPLGTVVKITTGSVTGTVSFDEAALKLNPPAAATPPPNTPPGVQPAGQPPQPTPQNGQPVIRQPRPRVVQPPPAAPAAAPGKAPNIPHQTAPRPDRRR